MNNEKDVKQNIPVNEVKETVKKEVDKKDVKKKQEKKKKKEKETGNDARIAEGVNLIPTLTEEEAQVEESKRKLNLGSIVSLLLLVIVSIGILGFNIFAKFQLNAAKEELYTLENDALDLSQKILDNKEILERILLYKEIQKTAYSPKEVIEYINDIITKSGGHSSIKDFVFGNDLSFEFTGYANNFEEVSKLWYLLTNDVNIEEVNLDTVGKNADGVSFSFEGVMVYDEFLILTEE
jgi:hypothetical protein